MSEERELSRQVGNYAREKGFSENYVDRFRKEALEDIPFNRLSQEDQQIRIRVLREDLVSNAVAAFSSEREFFGKIVRIEGAVSLEERENADKELINFVKQRLIEIGKRREFMDLNNPEHSARDVLVKMALGPAIGETINRVLGEKPNNNKSSGQAKNGEDACYIATYIYGSYDCPNVWTLRHFRDNTLRKKYFGRLFIRSYYFISPKIILIFGKSKLFHWISRLLIEKLVGYLQMQGDVTIK